MTYFNSLNIIILYYQNRQTCQKWKLWRKQKQEAMIMNNIKQTYGENTTCDFKEAVERKQPKSWLKRHIATMAHIIYVGVGKNGHWEVLSSQDVPQDVPRNVGAAENVRGKG